jgi:serine/threonine-protein kinase RsbW
MRSWVAIAADGDVVGHTALVLEQPGALVAEGGRAMVDPRYRGHHVMKHLTSFRRDFVGDLGYYGVYADSVTDHTRSQALYGGAEQPVTGLLLGYLPPTVSFRRIESDSAPHRQAVVMSYHPQREHHEMTVHPPVVARDVLRRIYDSHELPRQFGEGAELSAGTTSRIESRVWKDIGAALLVIEEPSADLHDAVRARLRSLRGAGVDVVYADVPLAHPAAPAAGEVLNRLGFVFGGVIPLLRNGGDVLRMQHLGDLDVDPAEIHLLSTMAQELLEYVLERREAVS